MDVKLYTLEEANRALPQIAASIRLMQRAAARARETQDALSVLMLIGGDQSRSPEHGELERTRAELSGAHRIYLEEEERLKQAGVILRDLQTGLVDFYAMRGTRLVFLCWKLDEPSIGYWHHTTEGFTGRNPIREL